MMKRFYSAIALSLVLGAPVAMACDSPDNVNVDIPNGASASEAEMLRAQQAVNEAVHSLEAFVACVDDSRNRALTRDRDQAMDQAQRLASRFNRELRNYNRAAQLASR